MTSERLLHYRLTGNSSNPPVVFLHGFMGSVEDWNQIVDNLAETYYCLAIDLPGHGKSTGFTDDSTYTMLEAASGVVRVMGKKGVVPATVVGYSMGGRLALYLAFHYRHACSKLVLESANAGIPEDRDKKDRNALDERWAKKLEQGIFEDFLRTWYCQPIFQTLAQEPKRLEGLIQRRLVNDPVELARAMRGMGVGRQPSFWGQLHALTMPVLLLAGQKDSKYVDLVQSMAELLPHGRVQIVPQAGHNAHLEHPALVAYHIKEFILKE